MRGWTIGGSIALIALLAMGMASLRDPECEWAEIASGVAAVVVIIAAVLSFLRRGRAPACLAFAVVGGAYFLASWPIGREPRVIPVASGLVERLVLRWDGVTNAEPLDRSGIRTPIYMPDIYKKPEAQRNAIFEEWRLHAERWRHWDNHRPERLMFARKIAHAWLTLMFGGLAAIASSLIFGRRSRYDDSGREPASRNEGSEAASEGVGDVSGHL